MKPKRITANDISAGHPKNSHCSTDQYYANLATKFQNVLYKDEEIREFLDEIDPQFLRIISILLTLHAEDVITGAGIWRAFCLRHKELYGRFMPFGFDKEVAGDFDINSSSCFFDKNNPFYNEEIAIRETYEFLMCIDAIDGEFANYLIKNGMLKDACFPGDDKKEAHSLAQDNLDFLCRNLRRGVYGQE